MEQSALILEVQNRQLAEGPISLHTKPESRDLACHHRGVRLFFRDGDPVVERVQVQMESSLPDRLLADRTGGLSAQPKSSQR